MHDIGERLRDFTRLVLQHPELRREGAWRGLQQQRQVNVVGAKAHADLAKRRAPSLIEGLDVLRDLIALKHAQGFSDLESDSTRYPLKALSLFQIEERAKQLLDMLRQP